MSEINGEGWRVRTLRSPLGVGRCPLGCSACDIGEAQYSAADIAIRRASLASLDSTEIWSEQAGGHWLTACQWRLTWRQLSETDSLAAVITCCPLDCCSLRVIGSENRFPQLRRRLFYLSPAPLSNQDSTRLTATAIGFGWTQLVLRQLIFTSQWTITDKPSFVVINCIN